MVSLGPYKEAGNLWDRVFAAVEKLNTPESLIGVGFWGVCYIALCILAPIGAWALPLLLLTLLLASGTGVALTTLNSRRKEVTQSPERWSAIARRVHFLYSASLDVLPSDGDPIRAALIGTMQSFNGKMIDSLTANQQLDLSQKALARAQRKVGLLRESGRLDEAGREAIDRVSRGHVGRGLMEELRAQIARESRTAKQVDVRRDHADRGPET
jgi:hypothetical protein